MNVQLSPTSAKAAHAPAIEMSGMRRVLASAAIGQFVEWYDFVVYAYSASIIARLFFPNSDPTAALLSTFAIYAVGFLSLVILMMGGATIAIGLLPTYAQVGMLAPILLVICRLIQGFSAAGETIGSNALVAEHAPKERRGLYVAFTYSFANLPPIAAALLVLMLTNVLTGEDYASCGPNTF